MKGHLVLPAPGVELRLCVPDSTEPNVLAIRGGEYPVPLRGLFAVLRKAIPPPAKVLDLGGYLGGFGLAAAAAGYEVVIVEANPDNANWIRESVSLNRFAHGVTLVETAVGATDGWANFHAEGPYGHIEREGGDSVTRRVRQMTLPTLLHQVSWQSPDFIKMDIEGSEGAVLRGAASWFAEGHRPMLLYEANGHTLSWFGDSPLVLRRILTAIGYRHYEVEDDGRLRVPTRFEPRVVMDYLASVRPLVPVLPRRSAWKLLRRTAAALRRDSRPARVHVWRALRGVLTSHVA